MKPIVLFCTCYMLIFCNLASGLSQQLNIMAYYVPNEAYPPEDLPLKKLTHIILSFAVIVDGRVVFTNERNPDYLSRLVQLRDEKHPELKVMVACGGWGADGFSDAAFNDSTRHRFISSVNEMIEEFRIDGLDMDWEYPAIPAAGTKARDEDKQNFTLLMKGLKEMMNKTDRKQTLSFASAGWTRYYDNIEVQEVMRYADYMNIMTYDQVGGSSKMTGHHTPLGKITLEDLKGNPAYDFIQQRNARSNRKYSPGSVDNIVEYCLDLDVDPKQMIIGAAFYGRAWKGVPPDNHGLYQPNKGVHIGWSAYRDILQNIEGKNGYTEHWDEVAQAPFLYNPSDSIFVSYDSPKSVALKTEYAIKNDLGGIMFWQLSNDSKEFHLLDAMWKASRF